MGLKSGSKTGKGGKQNSGKLSGGKFQLQNALNEQDSDAEPKVDASVLRQSIDISVTGIQQAVKVYQTATEEIKNLLSNECDIIYECKVCRNLFRSLANFISHKRVYCKNSYCYSRHTVNRHRLVEDYTTVLQPEPAPCGSRDRQDWTTSDAIPKMSGTDPGAATTHIETVIPTISSYSKPKKDISQIVDNLSKKSSIQTVTETVGRISATHFYEDISKNLVAIKKDRKDHTIHLENMDTTRVAVFQTKLCTTTSTTDTENIDLMKAQVSEIQNMVSEGEATLDANGQVVMVNGHSSNGEGLKGGEPTRDQDPELGSIGDQQGSPKEDHVCSHCNMRFSTRKTLNHHMKSLHVTFRLWYPCPCCKNSFVNSWSVYRHLYKVHRKSTAQVRRLRPQIQKKAFKKDLKTEAAPPASPINTSQSSALKEMQRLDQENQAWMDNFEDDQELQRCGGCGRRFERRAALASHSQICQKRIAARNSNVKSRVIPSATSAVNAQDKSAKQNGAVQTEIEHVKPAEPEDSSIEIIYVKSVMESGKKPELSVAPPLNSKPPMPSPTLSDNNSCSSNTMTFTRIRHTSGSWSEPTKKDIPEKRIEIQIRRDYCKMGSSSMNVVQVPENIVAPSHASNESDSRPHSRIGSGSDSRPQSRIAVQEGEISDDFGREWGSVVQAEDQEKSEVEQKQTRMKSIGGVRMIKSVKDDKKIVSDTLGNLIHSGIKREVISQDDSVVLQKIERCSEIAEPLAQSNALNGKSNEDSVEKNVHPLETKGPEHLRKRRASKELSLVENISSVHIDCKQQLENPDSVMLQNSTVLGVPNKRRKQNPSAIRQVSMLKEEPLRIATKTLEQETRVGVSLSKPKKLEQFSPVMEKRMLELINMRRLQCLPCQKKFNKLTNLRRHVAVHMGWSRYRCLMCSFKCFSKYDCVAHAHKVHLGTGVRAQAEHMVQYIEIQETEEGKDAHSVTITNLGNINKSILSHCTQKMCTEVLENNDVAISAKPLASTKPRNDRINDSTVYSLSKQTAPTVSPGLESCLKKLRDQGIVEVTPLVDEDLPVTTELKKEVPMMETSSPSASDVELISNGELEEGDDKNGLPVPGDDGVNEEPNLPTDGATSSSQEDQKIALRKMVMQVIFGGATANPNDNLIAVSINGDLLRRKSEESKPRSISQTPESEIGEDPAGVERLCPSPAMSLPPGRSTGSTGNTPPKTGRDRPVRNRVRVEKEDFIYDLSDACLSPRKDADGQSYAAKTAAKRKQLESVRGELIKGGSVDNVSLSNNVDMVKCVPKLTLVRTEPGESSGAKPAQVGAKSTWSNLYSSPSECNSAKGTIVNVAGYNISTRKSPRVFDTKPIKQIDSSKEKRVS